MKRAIKLNTLLNYDGFLPRYMLLTDGKGANVKIAQQIDLPQDSVVVADRGHIEYAML